MTPQQGMLNPPAKKQKGLFSHKTPPPIAGHPNNQLNETVRRLRTLEERYTNLQTRAQVTEQNTLSRNRSFSTEIKTLVSDIHEIKREIEEIKNKILTMIKELQMCAKRDEVKVLERYVNLWEPVKFVTQEEVEDIVKSALLKYSRTK